jgi:hypothetical protein
MSTIRCQDPVELFKSAFKHVESTGHRQLLCADSPPYLGIVCGDCEIQTGTPTLWLSPLTQPQHILDPTKELFPVLTLAETRRRYLETGILEALQQRASSYITLWEHVLAEFLENA